MVSHANIHAFGVRSSNSIKVPSKTKSSKIVEIVEWHIYRTTRVLCAINWNWKENPNRSLKPYLFVCNWIWFVRCSTCSWITSTTQTILWHQRPAHIQVELKKNVYNENRLATICDTNDDSKIDDELLSWTQKKEKIMQSEKEQNKHRLSQLEKREKKTSRGKWKFNSITL